MSFWNSFLSKKEAEPSNYAFIDTEVSEKSHKVNTIGAVRHDGAILNSNSVKELKNFIKDVDFICGHNLIRHDIKYLFPDSKTEWKFVDTLFLSPLLFPERPYHRLIKDDKLTTEEANNPVNDCKKAAVLLEEQIDRWAKLPVEKQTIYSTLLRRQKEFEGFLEMVGAPEPANGLTELIRSTYSGKICANAILPYQDHPIALAYALALIDTTDYRSVTPGWVAINYPATEWIVKQLRFNHCAEGCTYCAGAFDIKQNLKRFFGYDNFRTFDGDEDSLQEKAAQSAVNGESLLAIFPTGGGKSLTFQLPALIEARAVHGLTVVISPLQSLMKDQVDNLQHKDIDDAVTINGQLDPITRASNINRVKEGVASLLYIAPEMLRSNTMERILLKRHVVRFVIDEAHCFSAWGQDFRPDYQYIGKFIKKYQEQKALVQPVPVSCFTATAKQQVVNDIRDYFRNELGLELKTFASRSSRTNLNYKVIPVCDDSDRYQKLRNLINDHQCPTIVYASRTKKTEELVQKLSRDGYRAKAFNGKMDADKKIANQDAFMHDDADIIVATSAFGMGVDKDNVGLVVHYEISDSLENYVQEAGRAARNPKLKGNCFVLFNEEDLDKHFILLNQTKINKNEIQQVWQAIKYATKKRKTINISALELARKSKWDDSISDIETRVRAALNALEQAGYIRRGKNFPYIYASGITVKNLDEAREHIAKKLELNEKETEQTIRIIRALLLSKKYTHTNDDEIGESRTDYLADQLGLTNKEVIDTVGNLRTAEVLADTEDMSAYLMDEGYSKKKSIQRLEDCSKLEDFILGQITAEPLKTTAKQLNDQAARNDIKTAREKDVRTILRFLSAQGYIRKQGTKSSGLELSWKIRKEQSLARTKNRLELCKFIIEQLYSKIEGKAKSNTEKQSVQFSVHKLLDNWKIHKHSLLFQQTEKPTELTDIKEALLYLSNIDALKLDGGFLVLHNSMQIERLETNNQKRYTEEDYKTLATYYKQKTEQIHIVGEYANKMMRNELEAQFFVQDYFQMDYTKFISKYFRDRKQELSFNITAKKYKDLFGQLSPLQMDLVNDKASNCVVVAAGPGSGKTRVLVHKLASLVLLEDVKHEQLLMLTFSRTAATEFKQRLMDLIGNAAHFVEIKTFHSYCFDLIGRVGNLEQSEKVEELAADMITNNEVEPSRIGKLALVIDEAQDMSEADFRLVSALMEKNEDLRVIAVGDDDQSIYDFRGSNSQFMMELATREGAKLIEMTDNYRSSKNVVAFANAFVQKLGKRIKSTPIISKSQQEGWVEVTYHKPTSEIFIPLAKQLVANLGRGTSCVLTQTNEEAAITVALLTKQGINAKLIQSLDGLRFINIAEVRYFIREIEQGLNSALITDETWDMAKNKTYRKYERSSFLPYLRRCVRNFEKTNRNKFYSDFKEYLFESTTEDFCDMEGADVIVSTIHKSKGREFDDVYMLISENGHKTTDSLLRSYYVGITRTKNRLFIHTSRDCFMDVEANDIKADPCIYEMPEDIGLQLSHRDVNLGFFKDIKQEVCQLQSGDPLIFDAPFLYDKPSGTRIAKLSHNMQKTLAEWEQKGYKVTKATVRFIVAWRGKDMPKEEGDVAVLLPDLWLKKTNNSFS